MPNMNSALFESVQGFLNRRSVSHSVECRLKSDVTPTSSSKRFSIGVTSSATVGPKLEPSPVRLWDADPPISTTAAGSLSTDCAKAFPAQRNNDTSKMGLAAFTGCPLTSSSGSRSGLNNFQTSFGRDAHGFKPAADINLSVGFATEMPGGWACGGGHFPLDYWEVLISAFDKKPMDL